MDPFSGLHRPCPRARTDDILMQAPDHAPAQALTCPRRERHTMPSAAPSTTVVAPSSRLHRWSRPIAIAFLVLLGIGAIAGGLMLVTAPDGSSMGFTTAMLAGSPFPDFLVPGLVLAGLFGIGSFVVAAMGIRNHPSAPFLAFAIGCAQMIWIAIELAVIGEFSFLHPTMFLVGAVIAAASVPWGWPAFQAWRHGRATAAPAQVAGH